VSPWSIIFGGKDAPGDTLIFLQTWEEGSFSCGGGSVPLYTSWSGWASPCDTLFTRSETMYMIDDCNSMENVFTSVPEGCPEAGQSVPFPEREDLRLDFTNPLRPNSVIEYSLPRSGPVRLDVFDIQGRRAGTLVDAVESAGVHRLSGTEIRSMTGHLPPGIYFARLTAGGESRSEKILVLGTE